MEIAATDDGVRPAGDPNVCFYCRAPKGEHKDGCVCLQRSVVVEYTVQAVIKVPRSWSKEDVEFHRNDSSFCLSNDTSSLIEVLEKLDADGSCACPYVKVSFVREATQNDHDSLPNLLEE